MDHDLDKIGIPGKESVRDRLIIYTRSQVPVREHRVRSHFPLYDSSCMGVQDLVSGLILFGPLANWRRLSVVRSIPDGCCRRAVDDSRSYHRAKVPTLLGACLKAR